MTAYQDYRAAQLILDTPSGAVVELNCATETPPGHVG